MKEFLKIMWKMKRISGEKLRSYCPIFLTEQELDEILNAA